MSDSTADSKGEERIAGPLGTDGGWTKTVVGLGHYCDACQELAINRVYHKDGKVRHYSCQARARAASMSQAEKIEAVRRIFDVFPEDDMPDVFEGDRK